MTSFIEAVQNQKERTENGMKARKSTTNACVDLFFNIGASRGKNIVPGFISAFIEDPDKAIRILQWARDVRGGSGERQLFKDTLSYLESNHPTIAKALIAKIPELGRWDDMLIDYKNAEVRDFAYNMIKEALLSGDRLCSKWMPRQKAISKLKGQVAINRSAKAVELQQHFGWTPKRYRKTLSTGSTTVETDMCSKKWKVIDFGKVPSLAISRYRKAFNKNAPAEFNAYVDSLTKGTATVNAGAIYPYDVIKNVNFGWSGNFELPLVESNFIAQQWNALEDFVGDANVLPLVDVSGSMNTQVGGNLNLKALNVAISLGLYVADKNQGKFKDTFLTFSSNPELLHLKGDIISKMRQMSTSKWGGSTDLHAAFTKILNTALAFDVPKSEMPKTLIIFSDMQFNQCARYDDSAIEMIRRKYTKAGYEIPNVVFWNLSASDNIPVKYTENGVALVSGFSPSVMKAVIQGDSLTPVDVMDRTIMIPRYDLEIK